MPTVVSKPHSKKYVIFLNISFLLILCFFIRTQLYSSESLDHSSLSSRASSQQDCKDLQSLKDYKAKCLFLKSNNPCVSQGLIDYLYLFYCIFGRWPPLGYSLLSLWLLVLFYLLGDTASEYFCSSLESLSSLLKLPPAVAGVTILSLGNGAPDVFACLVSFMGTGARSVGLNSVVGGAFFVSCVVVGVISIFMGPHQISVNKSDFVRDVCFLILGLLSLVVIVIIEAINLWGAMAFVALYILYVLVVYFTHFGGRKEIEDTAMNSNSEYGGELGIPILCNREGEEDLVDNGDRVAGRRCFSLNSSAYFGRFLYILELPLSLPRRLTIPVVCEERWSKPFAVASVTFAPVLLAVLWNCQRGDLGLKAGLLVYVIGGLLGMTFGILAFVTTEKSKAPKKCLFPWLAGGFLMSAAWSYIIAQELIGLLVSLGYIFSINPSILGLTVLAWGNSLGDLVTNSTMALNGGSDGTQVAISGCYAGPTFNLLIGLGMSLVISSWSVYPCSVVIPRDPFLLETLALSVVGLLWALVILTRRNMRVDGVLGVGLLVIYVISISLRITQTLGSSQLHHVYSSW